MLKNKTFVTNISLQYIKNANIIDKKRRRNLISYYQHVELKTCHVYKKVS